MSATPATAFAIALSLVLAGAAAAQTPPEARTLKERLSDKASDQQRIDNCHVPPAQRGPQPRPDCPKTWPPPPRPNPPAAAAAQH